MSSVEILIADDHELFRRTVRSFIESNPNYRVCGEAGDGIEAIEKARQLRPQVVLMDINMPRMDGLEATRVIRREIPECNVIIVTQNHPTIAREQARSVDAKGSVTKSDLTRDLLPAIEQICGHVTPEIAAEIPPEPGPAEVWVRAGGALGRLVHDFDWSNTPLGALENWSQSLKTVVRVMLTSRFAMWMSWGPELTFLYNDAYAKMSLGKKHPWALGKPARKVWEEIWEDISPRIQRVLDGGQATWDEALLLFLERSGYREETYHTFSYSPLSDDDGTVAGHLCVVTEETDRVIGDRRLKTLRSLSAELSKTITENDVVASVSRVLEENQQDLPFTLIYLPSQDGKRARLVCRTGVGGDGAAAPEEIEFGAAERALPIRGPSNQPWPIQELLRGKDSLLLENLSERFDSVPCGAWDKSPDRALLLPIASQTQATPAGVLVAGLNPYRPLDVPYAGFLKLIAGQIAASIVNARAYEEEKKRAEALAEIDRAKTAFFSNISHEFRTPLTLMLGPLEDVLAKPETDLPPESRELLSVVKRNSLRLQKMVNALLEFSRIESGRVQAQFEPLNLAVLTTELASGFRSAIERANLTFKVDCQETSSAVYVDREMWEKIVLNLLSNAFKFTFAGEIEVALRSEGDNAVLTVRDTGVGVKQEELPRLFERFHRVEGTKSRTHEGSGIGLALVQELVKMHGGEISATSEFGAGTTFRVTVPFGDAHLPADQVMKTAAKTSATPSGGGAFVDEILGWLPRQENVLATLRPEETGDLQRDLSARILVADDNADMRDYVARLLGSRWAVKTVADGQSAWEAIKNDPPTLVVADVMMPNVDGFGLLREMRSNPETRSIPMVLLSARAGEESRVEGLEAGADDYIVKPFAARELLARVAARLDLHRLGTLLEKERSAIDDLFRQTPVPIAVLSGRDLVYTIANSAYEEVVGKQNIIGKPILEALPELQGQGFDDLARNVMRTGKAYIGREALVKLDRHGTGQTEDTYFTFIYSPLGGQSGPNHSVIAICSDVTDHVLARKRLQLLATEASVEKEKFRTLSETLDVEVHARTKELEERNAQVLSQSEQLRDLSWRLLNIQDEERRHIARELHDSAGQTLAVLAMSLAQLVQKTGRTAPTLATDAEEIQDIVQQLHREIRTASYLLHPPLLDETGLCSAITWYVQGLAERGSLEIKLNIPEQLERFPREIELAIFRLVQESLTNINRHSGSKTGAITITHEGDTLTVVVEDQGKGMSAERLAEIQSRGSGVGIRGMRERLRQFHGTIEIQSNDSGTKVVVTVPVPEIRALPIEGGIESQPAT